MLAIWKREVQNYFLTSIGYVFMAIFLLVGGVMFFLANIMSASADMSTMFSNLNYLFMLIVPILTMKSATAPISCCSPPRAPSGTSCWASSSPPAP